MQQNTEKRAAPDANTDRVHDCPDISLIVPFHNEGRLAHRTLRGLEKCVTYATEHGLSVEIVLVLDRVTDGTLLEIISGWAPRFDSCQVFHVDYGSLSSSRNFGIDKSRGRFIATLDGDDLYCHDWLVKAFEVCNATGAIAHPELCYFFPTNKHLYLHQPMSEFRTLLRDNLWAPHAMAPRSVFVKTPYRPDTECFGYEDWLWNCETLAEGFSHVLVPQTLVAVRQKSASDSLCQQSKMNNLVVAPNSLIRAILSEPYCKSKGEDPCVPEIPHTALNSNSITSYVQDVPPDHSSEAGAADYPHGLEAPGDTVEKFSRWLKSILLSPRLCFLRDRIPPEYRRTLKDILFHLKQITRLSLSFEKPIDVPAPEETPVWIRDQLLDLATIEPEVSFSDPLPKSMPASVIHRHITPAMGALLEAEGARVFILPWLIKGGADLVALHYMNVAKQNVFFITTEAADNAFAKHAPPGSIHIDMGNTALSHEDKVILLQRLLLESDYEFIHTVNSRAAFDLFDKYRGTFMEHRIFASMFNTDMLHGFETGYAVDHLARLLDFFERITTDNLHFKRKLEVLYGMPDNLMVVHRTPFSLVSSGTIEYPPPPGPTSPVENRTDGALTILFAGRLCWQKAPEVAVATVEGLLSKGEKVVLDIWGESEMEDELTVPDHPAIRLRGPFDGFGSLRIEDYDVMLLTSIWEGLPNVLIESMGNGVPAVASNVGGIAEIVTDETGWLVNDYHNPRAFQEILRALAHDRGSIRKKGRAAQEFVAKNHSWKAFQKQAQELYWPSSDEHA